MTQRICRINQQFVPPGDKRGSSHFRNHGVVFTEPGSLHNFPSETGTQYAFNRERFPQAQLTPGMMDSSTGAHTCSGWTAIDFPVGEDADISAVMTWFMSVPNDDHSIEES